MRKSARYWAAAGGLLLGGVAAACNFIVGVGDYSSSGLESTGNLGEDSGPDARGGAPTDSTVEGSSSGGGEASSPDAADAGGEAESGCSPTSTPIAACATSALGTGSLSWACTGTARPQLEPDASLSCVTVTDGGPPGTTGYCCVPSSCSPLDAGASSCNAGWTGYACTGPDTPTQGLAPLACTTVTGGCTPPTDYCCTTPSCSKVGNLNCPAEAPTGWTCNGSDAPQNADPTLVCMQPSSIQGEWCCASATCAQTGFLNCGSGLNGNTYSCTGSDWPSDSIPSAGPACTSSVDGGVTDFCCYPSCNTYDDCFGSGTVCGGWTCSGSGFGFGTCGPSCVPAAGVTGDPCAPPDAGGPWAPCSPEGGVGTCNGYACTQACDAGTACPGGTQGSNVCVAGSCLPWCFENIGCEAYVAPSSVFCLPAGAGNFACQPTPGAVGDPCSIDSDCTAIGSTCDFGFSSCTVSCAAPGASGCPVNSQGVATRCAPDIFNSTTGYSCAPGCVTNTDCVPYGSTTCPATPSTCTLYSSSSVSFTYCLSN